jgi:hypothetical protein
MTANERFEALVLKTRWQNDFIFEEYTLML